MAGSKGKINQALFDRIYRYAQAHPIKNTAEMFHISVSTVNYIKKYGDYKSYREGRAAEARKYAAARQTKLVTKKEITDSPFEKTPTTPSTSLFGKPVHITQPEETEETGETDEVKALKKSLAYSRTCCARNKKEALAYKKELDELKANGSKISDKEYETLKTARDNDIKTINRLNGELAKYRNGTAYGYGYMERHKMEAELASLEEQLKITTGAKHVAQGERDALKKALVKNTELCDSLQDDLIKARATEKELKRKLAEAEVTNESLGKDLEEANARIERQRENLKKAEEVAVANEKLKDKIASLERVADAATTLQKEMDDYEPEEEPIDEPIIVKAESHSVRDIIVGVLLAIFIAWITVGFIYVIRTVGA